MSRPQTIQIFLPSGDPRGMRVAEITTRIVRVIEVPRSQLGDFLRMPEAQQVGVYFLMGELSEAGLPRTYIDVLCSREHKHCLLVLLGAQMLLSCARGSTNIPG